MAKKILRAHWPRVYWSKVRGQPRAVVDSRKTGFLAGRREYWTTAAEALASAAEIARIKDNEGAQSFIELTPTQRRDAAEALALLEPLAPATLLDAARVFVAQKELERKRAHVPSVDVAINAYLNAKRAEEQNGELARLTILEIESKMRIVRQEFGPRKVSELDEAAIREFLRKLPHRLQGKKNILTKLSQFLNFCRREGRWITTNPAEGIKVGVKRGEVEILTIGELGRLLRAGQRSSNPASVLPYLCVQLFAGLRPFEAAALRWERIDFDTKQIEVRAETSKTRQTRYVPVGPTLVEWLLPCRKAEGSILGPFFADTLRTVKRTAGFGRKRLWPKDCLRHCFGTFWLAVHKDRPHLAELMGNTPQVIRSFYRRAIPEATAEQFWTLAPTPPKPGKIIKLSEALA